MLLSAAVEFTRREHQFTCRLLEKQLLGLDSLEAQKDGGSIMGSDTTGSSSALAIDPAATAHLGIHQKAMASCAIGS